MRAITTSLAPNLQREDLYLAVKLLVQPWRWVLGRSARVLEERFINFFSVPYAYSFESGRTALSTLLRALKVEEGGEVLLQAYTCAAVPNAVLWAGLKPIYVDCGEDSFTMSVEDLERKISSRSRVLIIQHTFGHAADLKVLLEVAKKHHLKVIEDCAHTIGGCFEGKLLGTFGDAAIFSFGRDKAISSVFGGMVITADKELAESVEELRLNYSYPTRLWVVQQLLHAVVTSFGKFFYGRFSLGQLILEISKRLGLISKAVYPEEKRGEKPSFVFHRLPEALAVLALAQFKKIEKYNEHRRALSSSYEKMLATTPYVLPQLKEGEYPLRYTIRARHRDQILKQARREKIWLGDWYSEAIAPAGVRYEVLQYVLGSCPHAEELARTSLNLPTSIHINDDDAKRIVQFLKNT